MTCDGVPGVEARACRCAGSRASPYPAVHSIVVLLRLGAVCRVRTSRHYRDAPLPCAPAHRSGRRSPWVSRSASCCRHAAMSAWLPESSTSGTASPAYFRRAGCSSAGSAARRNANRSWPTRDRRARPAAAGPPRRGRRAPPARRPTARNRRARPLRWPGDRPPAGRRPCSARRAASVRSLSDHRTASSWREAPAPRRQHHHRARRRPATPPPRRTAPA